MTKIIVDIPGETAYEVHVAPGALASLPEAVAKAHAGSRVLLVTDSAVDALYGEQALQDLKMAGATVSKIVVPSGEGSKSVQVAAEIWDAMASEHLDRDTAVVALGGGVTGDLAGFTGSTFMRGLPIVQAPTTLLSMVDSSVGGKTGINLDAGKNLVGTFCQPRHVCADVDVLSSLPEREWLCGLGEVAKSAAIDSPDFFEWLEENACALRARKAETVQEAVVRCITFKASVVVEDKSETKGVRECLNYGHTLAHAIEAQAGYGVVSHGAAVAQGMRFAARLSAALGGASIDFVQRQDALLDALGLEALSLHADPNRLLELMMSDKKVRQSRLRFVLPDAPGCWHIQGVDPRQALEHLDAWQRSL